MSIRRVGTEILDGLAPDDPAAQRSRSDLKRIHRFMGTRGILAQRLRSALPGGRPVKLLELGAGDGTLMLGVAHALQSSWPAVELTLLDRWNFIDPDTVRRYAQLGWTIKTRVADALQGWADPGSAAAPGPALERWDMILANLFLHHFDDAQLAALLAAMIGRTDRILACEPRRAWLAGVGSRLLGAIGASAVTRTDAVLSVRAGFRAGELRALWPVDANDWTLQEHSTGLFSHCFYAARTSIGSTAP